MTISQTAPGGTLPGVFVDHGSLQMNSTAMARQYWSLRYYVCRGDVLQWRIPNTVHREMLTGTRAFPQFANAKLKILEVFVGKSRASPTVVDAKGSIYFFDTHGQFDPHPALEAMTTVIEGSKPRRIEPNVIDIGPTVRDRRWRAENIWRPTPSLLRAVGSDLQAARDSKKKIKVLPRLLA